MIRRKYFKKLFVIYFAFTLVYGVFLTSYFAYQNREDLYNQQINYHINSSEQVVKNLDQRIWSFGKYGDTLYLDDYVNEYLTSDKNYFAITKVYDKLRADMAVFTDMGARVAITKMKDDMVISNQFTRDVASFFEEMNFSESMIDQVMTFYENGDRKASLLLHDETYEQIHIVRKSYYNTKDFFLMFQSLDTNMLRLGQKDLKYHIYFEDRTDDIGLLAKNIQDGEKNYSIADNTIFLMQSSSIYPELSYLIESSYMQNYNFFDEYITVAILFGGLTLVGFVVAMLVTRNIYKPIKTVVSKFEDETHEAKDEFAFLESRTQDIITANDSLKQIIEKNQLDLRTKFLKDMVYGLLTIDEKNEKFSAYGLNNFKQAHRVVLIQLQEQAVLFTDYSSEVRAQFRHNVYTILKSTLTLEGIYFELLELNYSNYGLVLAIEDESKVRTLLAKLLKAIRIGEEVDIVMAIGMAVEDFTQIHRSYKQASLILDYKQVYDKRAIVTIEDVVDTDIKERFYYPLDIERDLLNATLNGNIEKISLVFSQLIHVNISERLLKSRERSGLLMSLLTTLRRIDQKMPLNTQDNEEKILSHMGSETLEGYEEVLKEVRSLYEVYAQTAKEKTESKDDEVSTLMIEYIEANYHEDVSLEDAAAYLNISAGYFCTIFKKLTGTNFKNYLNQYRVRKAKEMLINNPNEKIKELTLMLGYNNVNSFIRMFKKYEGISPGEFAKRHQNN